LARSRTPKRPRRKSATPTDAATARRTAGKSSVPPDWTARITGPEELDEALRRLPTEHGVYIMRDRQGEVVYVGKAKSLRSRVRQYFSGQDTRAFVPLLANLIGDIETIVLENNKEALLLENNLIKEHRPRFNVKLRDDSNYLVLRLDPTAKWPKLELVRKIRHDGAHYFGPYHSARSARSALRVVNRHFKLRTCTDYTLGHRVRPCLQFQIDRCPAPCVYGVDPEQYAEQVKDVALFLAGRHKELVAGLEGRMRASAEVLEFERAARIRDQLEALDNTLQGQRIVGTAGLDQDAIGMYREGGQVEFVVMNIRRGGLLGSHGHSIKGMELPDAEVLANFVSAYYEQAHFFPDEILLPFELEADDHDPLLAWLREQAGRKVAMAVPERGDRKPLVLLANRNAASNFVTRRNQREDGEQALLRLQERLGLSKLPRVIECYDVSHIQGSDTVASMVVFVDGVATKARYRSFKIRGIRGDGFEKTQGAFQNDDFASMYEVLGRRFRRAIQGMERGDSDDDTWALPDLIVIDGGKGQLGRVIAAVQDLGVPVGVEGIDIVALAKERKHTIGINRDGLERLKQERATDGPLLEPGQRFEEWTLADEVPVSTDPDAFTIRPERVFVPGIKDPIVLRQGSSERHLMERVRDEAHRFAIRHHRKRRGKRSLESVLDDIEGVGPALKRALVQHFGSIAAMRRASREALAEVKGIGAALAARIHEAIGEGGSIMDLAADRSSRSQDA